MNGKQKGARSDRAAGIGAFLRTAFAQSAAEKLPAEMMSLLGKLDTVAPGRAPVGNGTQLSDLDFKAHLSETIPHLRAFARSLSGNPDLADDLVQEALLKAWAARAKFQAGTSMRAWTFIILRNLFLSQMRRARFKGEWDELTAERILSAPAGQDHQLELSDLQRALMQLPHNQREAIILVGAGGFSYDEAAEICGCAVGTIKSRVARGRARLGELLASGALPSRRDDSEDAPSALDSILSEVDQLSEPG